MSLMCCCFWDEHIHRDVVAREHCLLHIVVDVRMHEGMKMISKQKFKELQMRLVTYIFILAAPQHC